jgi:hypothetical protein
LFTFSLTNKTVRRLVDKTRRDRNTKEEEKQQHFKPFQIVIVSVFTFETAELKGKK